MFTVIKGMEKCATFKLDASSSFREHQTCPTHSGFKLMWSFSSYFEPDVSIIYSLFGCLN